MKSKLEEAFDQLKAQVLNKDLRWIEPIIVPQFDHPDEMYLWAGDVSKGQNAPDFIMACDHEDKIVSHIASVKMIIQDELNTIENYKKYLQCNDWL